MHSKSALIAFALLNLTSVSCLQESSSETPLRSLRDDLVPPSSNSLHLKETTTHFEFEDGRRHNSQYTYHRRNSESGEEKNDKPKPWGAVFLGTILVNLATLSGVIVIIPALNRNHFKFCLPASCCLLNDGDSNGNRKDSKDILIPYFAAGALLATVIFLVLPEALSLIQTAVAAAASETKDEHHEEEGEEEEQGDHDEHEDEHSFEVAGGAVWRFGLSLCIGYLFPIMLSTIFPNSHQHHHLGEECCDDEDCEEAECVREDTTQVSFPLASVREGEKDEDQHNKDIEHSVLELVPKEDNDAPAPEDESHHDEIMHSHPPTGLDWGLILSILVGDGFHNFCDGIFIGVAFMLCSTSTAYAIVASTIYHEVAQEVADFFLLTKHAGLTTVTALALNFVAGLSVVLGGVLILALNIPNMFVGVLLALTAGVYLHIAVSECIPRAEFFIENRIDRLWGFVMFACGAVPIGLISVTHTHCDH